MREKVPLPENSSGDLGTGSKDQLDPEKNNDKGKKKLRTRSLILIGIVVACVVGIAIAVAVVVSTGGDSEDPTTPTPSSSTTSTSSTTTTTPTPTTTTTATTTTTEGPTAPPTAPVETEYGYVIGNEVDVEGDGLLGDMVNTFHGIPYAKPPVGALRWAKPESPEPWSETLKATTLPPMCIQGPGALAATHQGWDNFQEDCLYLNIYAPKDNSKGLYPVMVYMHGGGFGVSGSIQYPGHYHAQRGVVMVNLNYRLNVFGFSSTDEPDKHSNFGMWDMLKALQFVRDNIDQFGGDPERITIFGESAGGVAIGLFVLTPHSTGMFHQAIYTSGTEMGSWAVSDPTNGARPRLEGLAEDQGCEWETNDEMLDCLRAVDAETIFNRRNAPCSGCRGYGVVVDGPGGFVPEMPIVLREKGYAHPVPIMAGTNMDESSLGVLSDPTLLIRGLPRDGFERRIRQRVNSASSRIILEGAEDEIYHSLLLTYSPWPLIDDGELNKIALGSIQTDTSFLVPTNHMLDYHNKIATCYQYVFDVKPTLVVNPIPRWIGVPHAFELPYAFGWPMIQNGPDGLQADTGYLRLPTVITFNRVDRDWSKFTIDLWTNFAIYGNPTPDENPLTPPGHGEPAKWLPQTEGERWWFHIDNEITTENPEPARTKLNFRPLQTSYHLSYAPNQATGRDLHDNGVDISNSDISAKAEYYELLLQGLNWKHDEKL